MKLNDSLIKDATVLTRYLLDGFNGHGRKLDHKHSDAAGEVGMTKERLEQATSACLEYGLAELAKDGFMMATRDAQRLIDSGHLRNTRKELRNAERRQRKEDRKLRLEVINAWFATPIAIVSLIIAAIALYKSCH